jgi:hypothetical protein
MVLDLLITYHNGASGNLKTKLEFDTLWYVAEELDVRE